MKIRRLSTIGTTFDADLKALLAFETAQDDSIDVVVANILKDVKNRGDAAVLEYTNRFDKTSASHLSELEISQEELQAALKSLPTEQRQALQAAADRVKSYHEKQVMQSWSYTESDGTLLGQQVTSLDRVGLYVPGGKAAYPSSVLMNAIPAKVAGVAELIMVVPTPNGEKSSSLEIQRAFQQSNAPAPKQRASESPPPHRHDWQAPTYHRYRATGPQQRTPRSRPLDVRVWRSANNAPADQRHTRHNLHPTDSNAPTAVLAAPVDGASSAIQ